MDAALNFLQGHQEIAWLLAFIYGGTAVFNFVDRATIKKLDKRLLTLSGEKGRLNNEVNYLIRIRWYIKPVVVDIDPVKDISWQELVRQGVATSTYPDEEVSAAKRVMEKVDADRSVYGGKKVLFLDPAALRASSKEHKRHLAVIDGALNEQTKTA